MRIAKNKKIPIPLQPLKENGREEGIRTLDTREGILP